MAVHKRRADIRGREKSWEYVVEVAGRAYRVTWRQIGHREPVFLCSCGIASGGVSPPDLFFAESLRQPCGHIAEVEQERGRG
jgi:hypothetical protein